MSRVLLLAIHQIRCTARIHDIYWQTAEKTIEEETPRVMHAASSSNGNSNGNSINWLNNIPYDQYLGRDVGDKYDSQFQGKLGEAKERKNGKNSKNGRLITLNLLLTTFLDLFACRRHIGDGERIAEQVEDQQLQCLCSVCPSDHESPSPPRPCLIEMNGTDERQRN